MFWWDATWLKGQKDEMKSSLKGTHDNNSAEIGFKTHADPCFVSSDLSIVIHPIMDGIISCVHSLSNK